MPMPLEQEATLDEIQHDEQMDELGQVQDDLPADDLEVLIAGDEAPADEEAPAPDTPPTDETPPADDTPSDDPLDAELEAADKAYPEPIRKRIKREIRIRKRVEAEFEQVKEAAIQVAQLAQDRETELTQAREALKNLQRTHAEVLDVTFDKEIQIKSAVLRQARTDGDYDAEMKVQSELDTLRFQQNQVREAKRNMGAAPAKPAAPKADTTATPAPAAPAAKKSDPPPPGAVKWVEANKVWFNNPQFAGHKQFVLGVDAQMVKEGYDKMTDAYYTELDRRVDEAFPTLRKAAKSVTSPVAPAAAGGGAARSSGGKRSITLTKTDLETMRVFGLDPSNKAHLQEYARNKVTA